MFSCTPLVYSLGALCSFFIYLLLFTDQKKKKKDYHCGLDLMTKQSMLDYRLEGFGFENIPE